MRIKLIVKKKPPGFGILSDFLALQTKPITKAPDIALFV